MVSLKESSETGCGGATSPLSPSNLVVPSEWTALTGPRRLPDYLAAYQPSLDGDIDDRPAQSERGLFKTQHVCVFHDLDAVDDCIGQPNCQGDPPGSACPLAK